MKNNNTNETIVETLRKCGIIHEFTYEEMDKIAKEEMLREKIREQIQQKEVSNNSTTTKKSPWCTLSGIFYGPILIIFGGLLLSTPLSFIGIPLFGLGILSFLVGIGTLIVLVLYIVFGISRIIIKHI